MGSAVHDSSRRQTPCVHTTHLCSVHPTGTASSLLPFRSHTQGPAPALAGASHAWQLLRTPPEKFIHLHDACEWPIATEFLVALLTAGQLHTGGHRVGRH